MAITRSQALRLSITSVAKGCPAGHVVHVHPRLVPLLLEVPVKTLDETLVIFPGVREKELCGYSLCALGTPAAVGCRSILTGIEEDAGC